MFQVDVDNVLFATGAMKPKDQARKGRYARRVRRRVNVGLEKMRANAAEARAARAAKRVEKSVAEKAGDPVKPVRRKTLLHDQPDARKQRRVEIQALLKEAQELSSDTRNRSGPKRKQALRAFMRKGKALMSQLNRKPADDLYKSVTALVAEMNLIRSGSRELSKPKAEESLKEKSKKSKPEDLYTPEQLKEFRDAITRIRENPIDETKPYATPWRPRPYMSAFAFVPRYLEVNHNICSAVYLRDPVARPSLAEVPTPFPAETQQLAFNWYLRRR